MRWIRSARPAWTRSGAPDSSARKSPPAAADAYVAPGRAGSRWDLCAGQAIIEAAGGRVTDARGRPIDYRSESLINTEGFIASNGLLHDEIVACLGNVDGEVGDAT